MRTRTLKIEATGDFWRRRVKPRIRISGYWLAAAGFPAGCRVEVVSTSPGCLTLRCVQASTNPPDSAKAEIDPVLGRSQNISFLNR